jgi:hypothetical protein
MAGWFLLGFLVMVGIALMFWIDLFLGSIFAVFCVFVCWFVFGVLKRKVDLFVSDAASKLGLTTRKHPFRYVSMIGEYKGRPVRISYESSTGFGLGSVMVTGTAPPGLAALDICNITMLKMKHGGEIQKKRVLDQGPPVLVVRKDMVMIALDGICTDPRKLKEELNRLAEAAQLLFDE